MILKGSQGDVEMLFRRAYHIALSGPSDFVYVTPIWQKEKGRNSHSGRMLVGYTESSKVGLPFFLCFLQSGMQQMWQHSFFTAGANRPGIQQNGANEFS